MINRSRPVQAVAAALSVALLPFDARVLLPLKRSAQNWTGIWKGRRKEERYSPNPSPWPAYVVRPRFPLASAPPSIHSSPSHHFISIFSRSNNANAALVEASHPFAWLRIPIRQPTYILFCLSSSFLVFFLGLLETTFTAPRSANLPTSRFSSPSFSWPPCQGY